MMILDIQTTACTELLDVTGKVRQAIAQEGLREGLCHLYVPHTTAGITINEAADPSVADDILMILNRIVPWQAEYRHREGNSPAHVKATLVGASQTVAVKDGDLVLGTWQGIFLCEFDGPRRRKLHLTLLTEAHR
jgi:secondary thiamine-phosphate synthase enzyme